MLYISPFLDITLEVKLSMYTFELLGKHSNKFVLFGYEGIQLNSELTNPSEGLKLMFECLKCGGHSSILFMPDNPTRITCQSCGKVEYGELSILNSGQLAFEFMGQTQFRELTANDKQRKLKNKGMSRLKARERRRKAKANASHKD